jgi:hypothetical protein
MNPETHNDVIGAMALKLPDDPEVIRAISEFDAQFMPKYLRHCELRNQLEEFIELFQTGEHAQLLDLMRANDSLPELFMVMLEYVCRDPGLEAAENAHARHAKTKDAIWEMRELYLSQLADNPNLTKNEFAQRQHLRLTHENEAQLKEIGDLNKEIAAKKARKLETPTNEKRVLRELNREIKDGKEKLDERTSALVKPYAARTIAQWLNGVEPLMQGHQALD